MTFCDTSILAPDCGLPDCGPCKLGNSRNDEGVTVNQDDEKFLGRVNKHTSGCWLWTGPKSWTGYGDFYIGKKKIRAHRYSYEKFVGPIGDLYVCHRCDVRLCVNPEHLFTGTNQDNVDDMVRKGRNAFGERHGSAKLTEAEAFRIVILCSVLDTAKAAKLFQVNVATVKRITAGELWKTTYVNKARKIAGEARAARAKIKEVLG